MKQCWIRLILKSYNLALSLISSGEPASSKLEKPETPLLIAARNGITEIMEKILHDFPHAVHDEDTHKKNVVLLAVQYRQPHVYQFLLKRRKKNEELDRIFLQFDDQGNSARHLAAATIGDYKPWRIPGAALQLQWEIKWYKVWHKHVYIYIERHEHAHEVTNFLLR